MVKSPTLYKLAADRQYDEIPGRVQSNPLDCYWMDSYGSTALHILCQARTVEPPLLRAVDAILTHAPELVSWANVATWTPLHFAVERRLLWGEDESTLVTTQQHHQQQQLILRLLQACPSAVSLRTRSGYKTKTPFHIACEAAADYETLQAMLQINPKLATEPFCQREAYATTAENPLQLLWKAHLHNSNSSSTKYVSRRHTASAERKMALLLQAAHCGTVDHRLSSHFGLLNAACSVRTPSDYFMRVLKQHQPQVSLADSHGLYALHYAVRAASPEAQVYFQYVLEALLKVFPHAAAIRDTQPHQQHYRRLPLHTAIHKACLTWHKGSVDALTLANVSALREPDPYTHLVPFLASAPAAIRTAPHSSRCRANAH